MHRKQYKKFIPFTFYNEGKIILIIKRTHTIQMCKRTKKNSCIVGSWMMVKLFLKESIHFLQSFIYNVNVLHNLFCSMVIQPFHITHILQNVFSYFITCVKRNHIQLVMYYAITFFSEYCIGKTIVMWFNFQYWWKLSSKGDNVIVIIIL